MGADKIIGVAVSSISKIGNTPIGNIASIVGQPVSSFTNTYSFEFDGIDEYINCGSFTPMDSATALTVSVWFKSSTYVTNGRLVNVEKHVEIYQSSSVYSNTRGRFYYKLMGAYGNSFKTLGGVLVPPPGTGAGNLVDGNWHHLCFVWDDATTTAVVYEDGVAVITDTSTTGTLNSVSDNLYIGADPAGANAIDGNIDEVSIWDSALSPTDVAAIYNSGAPGDLTSLSPVGWWRMGDDASWGGSDWTLTDQGSGGNNGASINMEEADRKADVPT